VKSFKPIQKKTKPLPGQTLDMDCKKCIEEISHGLGQDEVVVAHFAGKHV
jgi:hypothetical protein